MAETPTNQQRDFCNIANKRISTPWWGVRVTPGAGLETIRDEITATKATHGTVLVRKLRHMDIMTRDCSALDNREADNPQRLPIIYCISP
ncbi:MAG TPA: hypothetical protein VGH08_10695 [Chthoniobacterales bacterium]